MAKTRRVLYEFKVGKPPTDGPLTLEKWLTWRQSEDERLERMREAAHKEFYEGLAAQFERDVNDLTEH